MNDETRSYNEILAENVELKAQVKQLTTYRIYLRQRITDKNTEIDDLKLAINTAAQLNSNNPNLQSVGGNQRTRTYQTKGGGDVPIKFIVDYCISSHVSDGDAVAKDGLIDSAFSAWGNWGKREWQAKKG